MRIADLVDLEVQLARDSEEAPKAHNAEEQLKTRIKGEQWTRAQVLVEWLRVLRSDGEGRFFPGSYVESAIRWVRALLVLAGLVVGWGSMTALVEISWPHPVNVWSFLLGFVFLQVLLFLVTLGGLLAILRSGDEREPGPIQEVLSGLIRRLVSWDAKRSKHLGEWRQAVERLRRRRQHLGRLEPWILLQLSQAFGVAFNVAAAAALLRLVTFTDVAFSWSTTLGALDPPTFHGIVTALARPWEWALPESVPSRAAVEATRYWHLEGRYAATSASADIRGSWWPFLTTALVVYGLLPRLAVLFLAMWRARSVMAEFPTSDAASGSVLRRLGLEANAGDCLDSMPGAEHTRKPTWAIVQWREAALDDSVRAALARRTGNKALAGHGKADQKAAGGPRWEGPASKVLEGVWPPKCERRGLVFLAEAHEPADKATLRFLREARGVMGAHSPLVVLLGEPGEGTLHDPASAQLRSWRERLAALEDLDLSVEPLRMGESTGESLGDAE